MTAPPINLTDEERFRQYVRETDDQNECWLWTGGQNHGYGSFAMRDRHNRRSAVQAHRFAYNVEYGEIPAGYEIHHDCEQKLCVNPGHLVLLTRAQHARLWARTKKKHCVNGHPLTADNTYHAPPSGWRQCRTCRNERARARRRRQTA
jgi:hypothetical protein